MTNRNPQNINDKLGKVFKSHNRQLYFTAYKVVRNFPEPADAARDIVSGAFCKALKGEWRGDSSLYTFLFSCVKNAALDHIRLHEQALRIRGSKGENVAPCADNSDGISGRTAESRWLPSDVTPTGFPGPLQALLRKERRRLVMQGLDILCTDRERAVWEMCKLDGLTTTAAGEQIGVSQPTAHRALNSAMLKIREYCIEQTA